MKINKTTLKRLFLSFVIFFLSICNLNHLQQICQAEEKPSIISFYYLTSPNKGENSALSGSCTGNTSSYEIECKFWQTRVRLALQPEKLPTKLEEMRAELRKEAKDFDKFADGICEDVLKQTPEIQKKLNTKNLLSSSDISYAKILMDICKNPSLKKFEKFFEQTIINETKTCNVSSDNEGWTAKFKKVAPNKWISNEGPSGLCENVFLFTLEHEPKYPGLWKYTQVRTYSNQDNELCKGLEVNKPLIYDWHGKTIELNCQFIEYGF